MTEIHLQQLMKKRLACINTPEIKMEKADPIAAKEARDSLNALVRQFGEAP